MSKLLVLNNEQTQTLYNLLSNLALDRIENKVRWKFLSIFEDSVLDYELVLNAKVKLINTTQTTPEEKAILVEKLNTEIKEYSLKDVEFTFKELDIFAEGKELLETAGINLSGRVSKVYTEIEMAFLLAKDLE